MFFSKKTEILVKTIIVKLQVERKLKKDAKCRTETVKLRNVVLRIVQIPLHMNRENTVYHQRKTTNNK